MGQSTGVLVVYGDGLSRRLVEFLESGYSNRAISRCAGGFRARKQITESLSDSSVGNLIESEEEPDIVSDARTSVTVYFPGDTGRDDLDDSVELPGNNDQSLGRLEGLWSMELKYSVEMERTLVRSTD